MTRYLSIEVGNVRGRIKLLDDLAPKTVQALCEILPIEDRTVPVRWSGNAWRSERDYLDSSLEIENRPVFLKAGDLAYYPRIRKICFAYGKAQWRGPDGEIRDLSLVGQVDRGLDEIVAESERAHTGGSVTYRLSLAEPEAAG